MAPPTIPDLRTSKKLGFIVPSSNTVVEPTCTAILHALNASSTDPSNQLVGLYTRIPVTTVGTDTTSTAQFSTQTMVQAARLLADAECDAILWNGTSGMWVGRGLAEDEALAQAMAQATGVPCATTTMATVTALREMGRRRVALAVPYSAPLTQKLVEFFTGCGFEVLRAERLERTPESNLEIGRCKLEDVEEVIVRARGGVGEGEVPDAVVVACTNWAGAGVADALEKSDAGRATIMDSITVTVWMALRMIGWKGGVEGWGKLMERV